MRIAKCTKGAPRARRASLEWVGPRRGPVQNPVGGTGEGRRSARMPWQLSQIKNAEHSYWTFYIASYFMKFDVND